MSFVSDARPVVNVTLEDGDTTLQHPPADGQLSGRAVDVDVNVRIFLGFLFSSLPEC